MRGIDIGYVTNISMKYSYVLVSINVRSLSIYVPKNSLIETTQTGLLNSTIIDITPLEDLSTDKIQKVDVFSPSCSTSKFLCHNNYIQGQRGLNYDDLVRAATRISQRFDDPDLFNLMYLLLQNTLDISNDLRKVIRNAFIVSYLLCDYLYSFFEIM
uniref:Mce/MlaD domain-containing protein n=1 Tax=Melanthalia intermedia TaxID=172989 RepID=A0A345UAK7_9FLOR|nr:hypothetical protein [Melanthalia intermedia]AXI97493.1 hypothetical protein [Melanthalia intermedia]